MDRNTHLPLVTVPSESLILDSHLVEPLCAARDLAFHLCLEVLAALHKVLQVGFRLS